MWEKAKHQGAGHKILIWGPAGCWKTRLMLRLGNVPDGKDPVLAVLDAEHGTNHYDDEFNFARELDTEWVSANEKLDTLIGKPGSIVSLGIDSYTVLDKSLVNYFAELYLKRMSDKSPGHKTEFYIFQPSDHQPVNRKRDKFIRKLWESSFNIFMVQEVKNLWEGLKVVGKTMDAPERFEHFFDTVIEITERGRDKLGFRAKVHKDRSNILRIDKIYDWDTEEQAYELMKGFDLTQLTRKAPEKKAAKTQLEETKTKTSEPAKDKDKEKAPDSPKEDKKVLLTKVVALKKELHITDRGEWDKLLVSFDGSAKDSKGSISAMNFTEEKLKEFISKLEAMRPTDAQAD